MMSNHVKDVQRLPVPGRVEMEEFLMWKEFKSLPARERMLCFLAAGFLFFCIAAAGIGEYLYGADRSTSAGTVVVDIPPAATGGEIARILEERGVVKSASAFRAALVLTGAGDKLQTGHYRLPLNLTMEEVIGALQKGSADFTTVTIPEGATVAQMQGILSRAGLPGADHFADEAASYGPLPYMYGPEAAPVKGEGFLFADTYDIPVDYTARQICDLMYKRTDAVLDSQIRKEAAAREMSLHDLMTIASMVEREARFREDQVPIASVMLKRLQLGMPLQIDATVQYALGETKPDLTNADLTVDSPYNTYLRQGLPPGPIGAPGKDAIKAVLAAKPGEYLFYVAKEDGHHVFTKTYEEHNAQIGAIYGNS